MTVSPIQVFQDSYPDLTRYAKGKLGNLSDAEDIAQEAYLRMCRAPSFVNVTHARAFLFHVATNLVTDELRRRRTRARSDLQDAALPSESASELPEDILHWRARLDALKAAIELLPPRCREVFVLHKIGHHSHRDIASQLGISVNAVEGHVARGLAHCRKFDREFREHKDKTGSEP